jgi:hypothetical protein
MTHACFGSTGSSFPLPGKRNSCRRWASFAAIQKAREAAAAKHREMNLNPQEMFERLQIKAELGNYVPVGSA